MGSRSDPEDWLEVGRELRRVQQSRRYEQEGYPSFRAWVEAKVPFKYRKAVYLAQAAEKIDRLGLSGTELSEVLALGWTRGARIARVAATRRDLISLARQAKVMSVVDVDNAVRLRGGRRRRPDERRTLCARGTLMSIMCDIKVAKRFRKLLDRTAEQRGMDRRPGCRGAALAVLVDMLEERLGVARKKGRDAA